MTGTEDVLPTDKFVNQYKWNVIWIRDGIPYSVNHFPAGLTWDRDDNNDRIYKSERVEIRYELNRIDDFKNLNIDPTTLGYTFNGRGYRIGSDFDKQYRR